MIKNVLVAAVTAFAAAASSAAPFSLSNYKVTGNFALDTLNGMGLEASAVTYARDRGTLFFAGDEGLGVVEISRTGQTISTMSFSGPPNLGWPAASTNRDAEGLTYLGNGMLVVAEERLQDFFRFNYVAGGSVNVANAPFVSISEAIVNNNGIEGISVDPRNGSFVAVKQQLPQDVLAGTVTFEAPPGPRHAAAGAAGISPHNAIEGLTIDENGVIYLVAEHEQDGSTTDPHSRLIVLSPVPAPGTLALMFGGLGVLGWRARRQDNGRSPSQSGAAGISVADR